MEVKNHMPAGQGNGIWNFLLDRFIVLKGHDFQSCRSKVQSTTGFQPLHAFCRDEMRARVKTQT